ncbi:membrane protein insertion efficiency factor YidD [Sulfuricurvum sp.]|uniref:membrane protein insertion efficiency factor YidD n=1 Tax=Sulfuricurvum sp. TaxID=2025608 RepID=UPI0025D3662A|nr:membrane protein insertion efficiency factor YidD [Sulfuricurvum sp.]
MIRIFFLKLLWLYRHSFSLVTRGSCRHYPSCSEYALWQFERNSLTRAFISTFLRILRCNQLFPGGIDYPIINKPTIKPSELSINTIKYWFVPYQQNYFLIKNFKFKGSQC